MSDTPPPSDRQQLLAEQRTDAAVHRTLLAEQRTYSAWIRTGLASAATGFAIAKLLADSEPAILVKILAVVFILTGAVIFLLAFWAYRVALQQLKQLGKTSGGAVPMWVLGTISIALFVGSSAGLWLIF